MNKTDKLNPEICRRFREAVNESPIISNEMTDLYNLSCAVMDRLDTAVDYLNSNWEYPKTEEAFMCFLLFACMLNDGVDKIYKKTLGGMPKCNMEKKHFGKFCKMEPLCFTDDEIPVDEDFFEYLRSLAFAHPYETNRKKAFKDKFGNQVSPWVVVNCHTIPMYKFPEPIGVRLYASIKDTDGNDLHDIMFSFSAIKDYLIEKYVALEEVTSWVKNESEKVYAKWKQRKINREQTPCDILREICQILDSRHESIYSIEEMIAYLEIPISDIRNKKYVEEYRKYLMDTIPKLCDCVEQLDNSGQYEQERKTNVFNPLGLHQMAHYELEKIFTYLSEKSMYISSGSNEEWGIKMAQAFYNEFANKWVFIDVYSMNYTEIKLLVLVALFMECKEQNRLDIR